MVKYRKIFECYFNGMTQRTIEVAVRSSRHTIRDIVNKAKERWIVELIDYCLRLDPLDADKMSHS